MTDNKNIFIELLERSLLNNDFLSIKISKATDKNSAYKNLFIKKILLKEENNLNFVFNNKTQDITKNYNNQEAILVIDGLLGIDFKNAVLFTENSDITLSYNKKLVAKITESKATKSLIEF
ncbi:hypothetical protein LR004_02360, partial [Candidatus Gracilibacteria bacterium]|nr:hypothetical protein [Candidatus Gracilibacteria bacterium]